MNSVLFCTKCVLFNLAPHGHCVHHPPKLPRHLVVSTGCVMVPTEETYLPAGPSLSYDGRTWQPIAAPQSRTQ